MVKHRPTGSLLNCRKTTSTTNDPSYKTYFTPSNILYRQRPEQVPSPLTVLSKTTSTYVRQKKPACHVLSKRTECTSKEVSAGGLISIANQQTEPTIKGCRQHSLQDSKNRYSYSDMSHRVILDCDRTRIRPALGELVATLPHTDRSCSRLAYTILQLVLSSESRSDQLELASQLKMLAVSV